ncbi:uncharacterized protein LOC132543735 [Ylistrum balloti]|uniref:uncharacterized protein LOC132543735 n=1 Tax=Ylistrum balloti TaxID=509963 RepID=UPI002905BBDD|nr:uncharacterized protein LOC132543735 [Ylistrum balloti]
MKKWNHHPKEEEEVNDHAVEQAEEMPNKEGQENDETNSMIKIYSVENEHSIENLSPQSSLVSPYNGLNAMNCNECAECSLIRDSIRDSPDSIIFWSSIRTGPKEFGCHRKYIAHVLAALTDFAYDPCLEDGKTISLLKQLLHVDHTDAAAKVEYSRFARLIKYFGPVRRKDCTMLKQIHTIVQKSSVFTNKTRQDTVSWFAGDMTRDQAESLLLNQACGTYLVRMSQNYAGYFAVSVMSGGKVYHFAIEADVTTALRSVPYHANLRLHGLLYPSLLEAVQSLRSRTLIADDDLEIMCRKCCPNLTINAMISGYRKSTKRH